MQGNRAIRAVSGRQDPCFISVNPNLLGDVRADDAGTDSGSRL